MPIAGRTIIYDGNFTNTNLPVLVPPDEVDPLPTLGTLFYSDPTYPRHEWGTSATGLGSTPTNVSAYEAAALLRVPTTDLAGAINESGDLSNRFSERTSKGGAHGIFPPSVPIATTYCCLTYPDAIRDYVAANPNHKYYSCMSHRITYAQDTTIRNGFGGITQSDSRSLYAFRTDASPMPPTTATSNYIGSSRLGTSNDSETGLVFRSIAATGVQSTYGDWTGTFDLPLAWMAGRRSPWIGGGNKLSPSNILYFTYFEDLTVSGRTFAEVDALAQARHTAIHSSGGRYYGDTWTDPATYFASSQAAAAADVVEDTTE